MFVSVRKIYINGKFLSQQESGVQAYAKGLVNALIKQNIDFELLVPKSTKLSDKIAVKRIGFFNNSWLWEQLSLPLYLKRQQNFILLNFCNSAPLFITEQIVTIHDLAFEKKQVKWFSVWFKFWYQFLIPRLCANSKRVFTVSEFSKREISSHYKISDDNIEIIPNGLVSNFEITKPQIVGDYVLLIGGNNPRKNAHFVINQITEFEKRGLKLVILNSEENVFENQNFEEHPSVVKFEYVTKNVYYSLIKNSKALIYPSLYEGFGIPILEALSMKVPVICNDLSVFKESFDDLPIYFNSRISLGQALDEIDLHLISDESVEKLKSKFSFDKSVSLILNFLEKLDT